MWHVLTYIGAGLRLRYGQTDEFLPSKHIGYDFGLEFVAPKVQDRGKANDFAAKKTVTVSTSTSTTKLLSDDELWQRLDAINEA